MSLETPFPGRHNTVVDIGDISVNKKRGSAEYVVNSIPKLQKCIIPHFKQHPLHYSKQLSYLKLALIVDILDKKAHYDKEVFAHIIQLAYSMNEETNRTTAAKLELLDTLGVSPEKQPTPPKVIDYPLNENFLIGLIDADGCFCISFKSESRRIRAEFDIAQHISSIELLEKVRELLGCGTLTKQGDTVIRYRISSLELICSVLIPFMEKYQLYTKKAYHYFIFKRVCELLRAKKNISEQGFLEIRDLAYHINKSGKRRKITKELLTGTSQL